MKFLSSFRIDFQTLIRIFLISIVIFTGTLYGQNQAQYLRIAQSLERNHDYEQALLIYQKLYVQNRSDINVLNGIKKCYLGLQQYDELIRFLEQARAENPQDVNLPSDLAEAYYLKNDREKAASIWKAHLDRYRTNIGVYRLVAASMIGLRMFDDAILVYQRAMSEIKSQYNLHLDIANLYKVQLKYADAADHLLLYYIHNPKQFSYIQNQVLSLADEKDQRAAIMQKIRDFIDEHPDQKAVNEILASLYILENDYARAFEIYQNLEDKDSNGNFLFKFANQASSNDALEYAQAAYILLQKNYPESAFAQNISMNIAYNHMRIAYKRQSEYNPDAAAREMQTAMSMYDSLSRSAVNYYQRMESHKQIGNIYKQFYFDLDQAILHYQKYITMQKDSRRKDEVIITLGDVYLIKNQLKEANDTYARVQSVEYIQTARFKRIEILFYQGAFEKALKEYQNLRNSLSPEHHLFNDILNRTQLLTFFSTDTAALARFSQAELLIFQQKISEAATMLTDLAESGSMLSPRAGLKAAQLYFDLTEFDTARNILHFIRKAHPDDMHLDEIIFLQAQIEEVTGNYQSAFDLYSEIIASHQTSLHMSEARRQARLMTDLLNKEKN